MSDYDDTCKMELEANYLHHTFIYKCLGPKLQISWNYYCSFRTDSVNNASNVGCYLPCFKNFVNINATKLNYQVLWFYSFY